MLDEPTLRVGNNTYLGPGFSVGIGKEVLIGSNCYIASDVSISDNDGHPIDPGRRSKGDPVAKEDILPVRIADGVWVGEGARILKGVSVGAGAVIGTRSVVTSNIRPFTIVTGNAARTIKEIPGYQCERSQDQVNQ